MGVSASKVDTLTNRIIQQQVNKEQVGKILPLPGIKAFLAHSRGIDNTLAKQTSSLGHIASWWAFVLFSRAVRPGYKDSIALTFRTTKVCLEYSLHNMVCLYGN